MIYVTIIIRYYNPVEYCDPSGYAKKICKDGGPKENNHGSESSLNSRNEPTKYGSPYSQLSPKQKRDLRKKLENRTITKDEYNHLEWDRRFGNRRKRGVNRFWAKERNDIINNGKGTRKWNKQQRQDIINKKTPLYADCR